MPLVDGAMATRMIRHFERDHPELRKLRKRVPIIAVSASLTEENRFDYIEAGYVYIFGPSSLLCLFHFEKEGETNCFLASMDGF